MADAIKSPSRPQYCHEVTWNPLSYRWPSVIFNQHYGLPPLLDARDLSWVEGIFRRLGASSWPGYLRTPVFAPFTQASGQHISKLHREMSGGVSEVVGEMCKWKISLDVNHFAPSEITVKIQDGFLEIAGKHEERQDEHGYISRCFTRKYKRNVWPKAKDYSQQREPFPHVLNPRIGDGRLHSACRESSARRHSFKRSYGVQCGVDAENLQTLLSADGILTVEAPLPSIPLPSDVIIPIQVETEAQTMGEKQQGGDEPQDAEAKPESFEGEAPEPSISTEHPEGERDQQTVSDVDLSREPQPQSITEASPGALESGSEQVGEHRDGVEEDKEGAIQEAVEGIERGTEAVHESADKPQAPETPDTITSEQGEQAEVMQPRELEGEEGYTDPVVTEDEQSTSGQTQEVFDPQLELQKEMDVEKM